MTRVATLHGTSAADVGFDGEQSRDFTYVENVVQANLLACEAPSANGKVFNVGTGERFTLNQTLKLLERISGKRIPAKYEPARDGDIRDSQADISLARELLGYDPQVDFATGLQTTWDWYRGDREKTLQESAREKTSAGSN